MTGNVTSSGPAAARERLRSLRARSAGCHLNRASGPCSVLPRHDFPTFRREPARCTRAGSRTSAAPAQSIARTTLPVFIEAKGTTTAPQSPEWFCTLIETKDRGQSIVRLFFELFHYGTRFAWLDRPCDRECHVVWTNGRRQRSRSRLRWGAHSCPGSRLAPMVSGSSAEHARAS